MPKKNNVKLVAGYTEPKRGSAAIVRGVRHIMLVDQKGESDGTCLCGFTLKRWLEGDPGAPDIDPKVLALEPCQRCGDAIRAMHHGLIRTR